VLNRWSWLALGAGAYLAFTLSAFPASTAYRWFAPEAASFTGIEGTLWSGRAAAGTVAGLPVQDCRWQVSVWPLLLGRLGARLEARLADGFMTATLTATPSRVRFSEVRGSTSLATLQRILPIRGTRGEASVALSDLQLENGWPTAVAGDLRLAKLEVPPFMASRGQPQLLPLGDYTVRFDSGSQPDIAANITDDGNGGPLEVAGTLVVDAARAYTLDAFVTPRAGAARELVDGLKIMSAEPDAQGRYRLTLTGSL
jgi:hypothetical protein